MGEYTIMAVDSKALGRRIRAARLNARMSQEKLAELADVSTVHISNIESGNGNPSLAALVNIANVLAVSADELLCDSVLHCRPVLLKEIGEATADCSDYELRVLISILKASRAALKEDQVFKNKMKEYDELHRSFGTEKKKAVAEEPPIYAP